VKQRLCSLGLLLLASAAAGFWAMLLELLKAQRLAEYEGVWEEMLPGRALAFLIYWLLILSFSLPLHLFLARLFRRCSATTVSLGAVGLAGALVWMLIALLQHELNPRYAVLLPLTFPLLALLGAIALRSISSPWTAFIVGIALLHFGLANLIYEPRLKTRPWGEPPRNEPLLVFIVADALRADVCSAYGGPVPTPHLEALASGGLLFRHAYSPAPWTLPSMYSIAAGGYHPLPPGGVPTGDAGKWLPGMERGGVALIGNWLLGGSDGFAASFKAAGDVAVLNSLQAEHEGFMPLTPFLQRALHVTGILKIPHRPLDTSRVLLRQLRHLLARRDGQIGALYLHLMDPHDPYSPPHDFVSPRLRGRFFSPSPARNWGSKQLDADRRIALSEAEQAEARALYEAEVQYVDKCLGVVLSALQDRQAQDLYRPIRIVFTADHGEEFWDHGGFYHGHTLYQEQLHVPLIVAGSGVATDVVSERVSLTSLVPSLRGLDGEAGGPLTETLRSGAAPEASPVFAYATVPVASVLHDVAVIQGDYKLILHRDGHTMELYNLSADPREQHNLVQEEPLRAAELHRLLETWKAGTPLHEDETESREATERLEALGYL